MSQDETFSIVIVSYLQRFCLYHFQLYITEALDLDLLTKTIHTPTILNLLGETLQAAIIKFVDTVEQKKVSAEISSCYSRQTEDRESSSSVQSWQAKSEFFF